MDALGQVRRSGTSRRAPSRRYGNAVRGRMPRGGRRSAARGSSRLLTVARRGSWRLSTAWRSRRFVATRGGSGRCGRSSSAWCAGDEVEGRSEEGGGRASRVRATGRRCRLQRVRAAGPLAGRAVQNALPVDRRRTAVRTVGSAGSVRPPAGAIAPSVGKHVRPSCVRSALRRTDEIRLHRSLVYSHGQ